jgi:hypothetical protein
MSHYECLADIYSVGKTRVAGKHGSGAGVWGYGFHSIQYILSPRLIRLYHRVSGGDGEQGPHDADKNRMPEARNEDETTYTSSTSTFYFPSIVQKTCLEVHMSTFCYYYILKANQKKQPHLPPRGEIEGTRFLKCAGCVLEVSIL